MNNCNDLFVELKLGNGAIWVEDGLINLNVPKELQQKEIFDFIKSNKVQLVGILNENKIFSEKEFLGVEIFHSIIEKAYPLSPAQERLWFIEQYEEGTNAYHIPSLYELEASTNITALIRALQQIVQRHEVLRSTIEQGNTDEQAIQIIHTKPLTIEEIIVRDLDEYELVLREDINRPFNLTREYPIRVKLYILKPASSSEPTKMMLLVNKHHIASDGWSEDIFDKELNLFYEANNSDNHSVSPPPLEIQYKDYSLWQRSYLKSKILSKQIDYWRKKLEDFSTLEFPVDYVRPARIQYEGARQELVFGKELSSALRMLAQKNGVSLNSVMLGSFNILLGKYTGQSDIVTGSPSANRHHRQTEDLIGFFINTQVNRTVLSKTQNFEELIQQIHSDQTEAQLHQDLPFEKLVDYLNVERDSSRHPIFQIIFEVLGNGEKDSKTKSENVHIKPCELGKRYDIARFDLSVFINDTGEELSGYISYSTSLFKEQSIASFIGHYNYLLQQLVVFPGKPYSRIGLLNLAEHKQIVFDWNATNKEFESDKTIVDLFKEVVLEMPDAIAVVCEGKEMSYRMLDEQSDKLARHLKTTFSVLADDLVGIMLNRSDNMLIAIIAILKAGGAYVCIDPQHPSARKQYMLEDTATKVVITQMDYLFDLQQFSGNLFAIDVELETLDNSTTSLSLTIKPTDLAYVIYTSGSTGNPKGVMIEHRSVINYFFNVKEVLLPEIERVDFSTNIAFDLTVTTTICALLLGKKIIVYTGELSNTDLYTKHLVNNEIDFIKSTPSLLANLPLENFGEYKIKQAFVGGEKLEVNHIAHISEYVACIIDEYGPTETTVGATFIRKDIVNGKGIGKPYHNYKVFILDEEHLPVPLGVSGELYIGGAGVARGYLNRTELTTERFIENPFATQEDKKKGFTRIYKTGDIARWLTNGIIEYIGRNDSQVKIRGYRVELGEIENALLCIDGIKQACVVAKEKKSDNGNMSTLVAYYTSDKEKSDGFINLTDKLSAFLPEYLLPSVMIQLESFPLTINGKLDKRSLPDPDFNASAEEYVAPLTETEKEVCKIWEQLLEIHPVGISTDFFKLGGNSILAIQVAHRMSKLLGCNVKVADVFKYKTITQLLANTTGQSQLIIPKINSTDAMLSFAQERLWFIEQYEQGTNAYHIPDVYELNADANIDAVKNALEKIVMRHEVLHSTIEQASNSDYGIQKVHENSFVVEEVILKNTDDYDKLIRKDINRPFDLSKEYPVRIKLYRIGPTEIDSRKKMIVLMNFHHIASDGWSMEIFLKEFLAYYNAYIGKNFGFNLPALEIQYKDFASWQKTYLTGEVLSKQLSYWKNKLLNYQVLEFPSDYARPTEIDYRGASIGFNINEEITDKLRTLAQQLGVSMNSVMLSSFNILLGKYTGQDDIVIGSVVANRHHHQTEDLIGFFVNTQVNRTLLNPNQNYCDLIMQVQQDQEQAQLYQDLPFEKLVEELNVERDASRHPVFQLTFELHSFDQQNKIENQFKKIWKPYPLKDAYEIEKFDLTFFIDDSGKELTGQISYATSLFKKDTIIRLAEHYKHLLTQLAENPNERYSKFKLLNEQEHNQIIYELNGTERAFSEDKTYSELFSLQAEKTPNNIAVVFTGLELTYKELNERSNQLARHIRAIYQLKKGESLKPDTFIAICLERGPEMIVGILAILKAGAAYVPVDPGYPKERIDLMLTDTATSIILSQKRLVEGNRNGLPEENVIYIDFTEDIYSTEDRGSLIPYSQSNNLAYIIYTSGTTGKPKGALIEHIGMVNHMEAMIHQLNLNENSRLAQNAPQSFDISVWQMLTCLLCGGRTVIYDDDAILSTQLFIEKVEADGITVLQVVPSYLTVLLDEIESGKGKKAFIGLKHLITTGEAIKHKLVARWFSLFPAITMVNAYGPAEASDDISLHFMDKVPEQLIIPIGKCIQNLKIYIVDKFGALCPVGVRGEIWVSGVGVGRGYLNDKEKTKKSFCTDPFIKEKKMRLYKTGDFGRYLPDGSLEYLGRNDDQVKIRGYRIELEEIEHVLNQVVGIKQSCVLVKERQAEKGTTKYLVAYYETENQEMNFEPAALQETMSEFLPDFMIPTAFVRMESFPLTTNGKLDKRSLPDPDLHSSETEYVAPITAIEIEICNIWKKILGLEKIGLTDNFFSIGGNSILAIQISHRMNKELGFNVKVADIFKFPTCGKLIKHCDKKNVVFVEGEL